MHSLGDEPQIRDGKIWPLSSEVLFFNALHGMQMRSSNENSVCPSVCLSDA